LLPHLPPKTNLGVVTGSGFRVALYVIKAVLAVKRLQVTISFHTMFLMANTIGKIHRPSSVTAW
jgi:hypothetical protein